MGSFDTLVDGDYSTQVKCFEGNLSHYRVGDEVPKLHFYHQNYRKWPEETQPKSYTLVLDPYGPPRYVLIKNRVIIKFTNDQDETYAPYVARWGQICDIEGEVENEPYEI